VFKVEPSSRFGLRQRKEVVEEEEGALGDHLILGGTPWGKGSPFFSSCSSNSGDGGEGDEGGGCSHRGKQVIRILLAHSPFRPRDRLVTTILTWASWGIRGDMPEVP